MVQQNQPSRTRFEDAVGQRNRDQISIQDWMPAAQEGVRYDEEIVVTGGSGVYDFREQRANLYLPAGLRQDGHRIHGTPQVGTARTYEFPALAVDRNDEGNQDNKMVSLEVLPAVAQPVTGATGTHTGRRIGDPVPVNPQPIVTPQPVVPPAPVVHHDDHHHNNNWGWLIPTGLLALLLCGMLSVAGWVIATMPRIIYFGAQPNIVQAGQSSTGSWSVVNADQVFLDGKPVKPQDEASIPAGDHQLTAVGGPLGFFRPSAMTSVKVVGGGSPPPSNTPNPAPSVVPSVVPSVQPTPGPAVSSSDAAWRAEKCVWLRANFPQTTDGVQALGASMAKVSPNRISAEKFVCNPESRESVFSGFVGLGPREGHPGEFTMTVPQFGVIDSYPVSCGAKYSEEPTLIGGHNPQVCDETWRAYRGTITALRQTYWAFDDQNPPNRRGGVTPQGPAANPTPAAPAASASIANEQPYGVEELFKRNSIERTTGSGGQKVNEYGGLQGKATKQMDLPAKWEATCEKGLDIKENTGNRMIPAGTVCTIYPPYAWRAELGYKG